MTPQEAFEAWYLRYTDGETPLRKLPGNGFVDYDAAIRFVAWTAALDWAKTRQDPSADVTVTFEEGRFITKCQLRPGHYSVQIDEPLPLYAVPFVPKGWKLVPEEPTWKMLDIGHNMIDFDRGEQNTHQLVHDSQKLNGVGTTIEQDMRDAWAAMLAAAPVYKGT